jgi:predicted RNA-binding protein with PUA-like domain
VVQFTIAHIAMHYWLMKSEPEFFSITDLENSPHRTAPWEGVRNYQARNFIRDQMQPGDRAYFYHSSCATPGIAGIMEIARDAYPDDSARDPGSPYYDPKSRTDAPRWYMVDVRWLLTFEHIVTLAELRRHPQLENMTLLRRGNRLSVMPVSAKEWRFIEKLAV